MKQIKKMMALALAMVMVLAMSLPVFATTQTVGTGNGSITVSNAEVDASYSLYKLFDATVATDGSIAYSLPAGKDVSSDTFFNTYFEIKNGNVIAKDTFTEDVLKGDAFKTWAPTFGTQVGTTVKATESEIKFDKIPFGYYYVTSTLGTVLTVDSANPNATVVDKNQTVSFDKNIVDDPENPVKVNEAGLNEDIDFDITVTSKNYDGADKVFKYVVYDTMDPGFSLTGAPVVKVGAATLTADDYTITYKKGGAATTTVTEADYFEITIPWTTDGTKAGDHLYDANAKINVTYTAKLDPAKAASVTTGATPNKNIADVKYFKGNDTSDTPSGDLPDKQTDTYDTQLTIQKTDGSAALSGAEFTLTSTNGTKVVYVTESKYVADAAGTYYKLKDGTYTSEAPNNNATHDAVYDSTTDKYKLVTEAKVMGEGQTDTTVKSFVGADGKVTFTGLAVGTYKIEETVVPAGYNKADDIEFTVSFNPETKKFASSNDKVTLDATNNVFNTTIVNNKGTELPSTGGIGTTIFYVIGAILVLGAGILLVTRRRMNAN